MSLGYLSSYIESWWPYDFNSSITNSVNEALSSRWTVPSIASGGAFFTSNGGPRGNPIINIGFGSGLFKTMRHSSKWVFGIRVRTSTLNAAGGGIVALLNNNIRLFQLNVNPDGTLSATGNTQAQIIGTSDFPEVYTAKWTWIEGVITFTGTTNINAAAIIYVNSDYANPIINGNINTSVNNTSLLSLSTTANRFGIGPGMIAPGNMDIDGSFYIHDGTGDIPGVWGDGKIVKILPNGDTAQADWTPNSGTVHFDRVNELPKDDDTTYVKAGTVGNKDAWDWEDLPSFTGVIRFAQVSMAAKKDDEGGKAFRIGVGATLSEAQSTDFYINDTYNYWHYGWDLDPATTLAWTRAGFNAKQFGPELRA